MTEANGEDTLREWFDEFVERTGETPSHIVLSWGDRDYGGYKSESWPPLPDGLVAFGDVDAAILDRPFDAGFGGNESPNLCAWSDTWTVFSDNYDGAEGLCWVPRNPTAHNPARPGGG